MNEMAAILLFYLCVQDNSCNIFLSSCYAFTVTGIKLIDEVLQQRQRNANKVLKKQPADKVSSWFSFLSFLLLPLNQPQLKLTKSMCSFPTIGFIIQAKQLSYVKNTNFSIKFSFPFKSLKVLQSEISFRTEVNVIHKMETNSLFFPFLFTIYPDISIAHFLGSKVPFLVSVSLHL